MSKVFLRSACFATTNAQYPHLLDFYAYLGNKLLEPHGMVLRHRGRGSGHPGQGHLGRLCRFA